MTHFAIRICLIAVAMTWLPAFGQVADAGAQREDASTEGTVVSASSATMVLKTEDAGYLLFVMDRDTIKPQTISPGTRVRVTWQLDAEGQRITRTIQVTSEAPRQVGEAPGRSSEPVPPEIRRLERQIERQARRFRTGVRAGVGLDPEILTAGAHARLGPFFDRDVWFRPNVEVGFGEVTTLFALNIEVIYRLPITPRQSRWSAYVGAGPGLNLIDRNFDAAERGEREISFDDFDYETSLNILAGVEFRSGMFVEMKGTAYSRPNVKLLIGYSF